MNINININTNSANYNNNLPSNKDISTNASNYYNGSSQAGTQKQVYKLASKNANQLHAKYFKTEGDVEY